MIAVSQFCMKSTNNNYGKGALALSLLLNSYPTPNIIFSNIHAKSYLGAYQWENNAANVTTGTYLTFKSELQSLDYTDIQKLNILQDFARDLVSNMQDIPVSFAEVLDESFWDLI
jgi:hypothetical protein